jgi:hypothetical protein
VLFHTITLAGFLQGQNHEQHKELLIMPENTAAAANSIGNWTKYKCDICDGRTLNGKREWEVHLTSKAHKALRRKRNKLTKS